MKGAYTLRVGGVPEHFNLPWHLAQEEGIFDAHQVSVAYRDFPGGTGAMSRALESGELDVAIVLTEGIISAIHQGNPSRIITSYVDTPLIWGIHVAANGPLQTPDQLPGKTYAISRFGSGSHLMAIVDAMQRDWPHHNLSFQKVGNLAGAIQALPKGEADIFLWERYSTQPYVDQNIFRRIGEVPSPWPSFMIAVSEHIQEQYAAEVRSMLMAINKACRSLMKNPEAISLIASRYELENGQVKEWFDQTTWSTDLSVPSLALLQAQDALLEAQIIEKKLPVKSLCFVD